MIYAHVFKYMNRAEVISGRFIAQNYDDIKRVRKMGHIVVELKNGDEHYFMSEVIFDRWKLGRDYMYLDKLYHGYMPISEDVNL